MGGEGSKSLESRHVFMGQQYLGCSSWMGMGMMGMHGGTWFGNTDTNFQRNSGMMHGGYDGYGMYPRSYSSYPWWGGHILFWIVLIALVGGGIFLFLRQKKQETPLEVLKKRLASGDISEDEFQKKQKLLK